MNGKPYASSRLPYRVMLSDGWTVEETIVDGEVVDLFTDGDHSVIAVKLIQVPALDFLEAVSEDYRGAGRLVDEEPVVVGTLDGRIYRCRERRILRGEQWWIDVVFRSGPHWAWRITLERDDGRQPDEGVLRRFLGAFEPMPIRLRQDDATHNVWGLQTGECFWSLPLTAEPGAANIVVGGLDGFRRVSCDEPHTGQVLAVMNQAPEELDWGLSEEASQNGFGLVLCMPADDEPRPTDVAAMLVAAHQSGLWSGTLVDASTG